MSQEETTVEETTTETTDGNAPPENVCTSCEG